MRKTILLGVFLLTSLFALAKLPYCIIDIPLPGDSAQQLHQKLFTQLSKGSFLGYSLPSGALTFDDCTRLMAELAPPDQAKMEIEELVRQISKVPVRRFAAKVTWDANTSRLDLQWLGPVFEGDQFPRFYYDSRDCYAFIAPAIQQIKDGFTATLKTRLLKLSDCDQGLFCKKFSPDDLPEIYGFPREDLVREMIEIVMERNYAASGGPDYFYKEADSFWGGDVSQAIEAADLKWNEMVKPDGFLFRMKGEPVLLSPEEFSAQNTYPLGIPIEWEAGITTLNGRQAFIKPGELQEKLPDWEYRRIIFESFFRKITRMQKGY